MHLNYGVAVKTANKSRIPAKSQNVSQKMTANDHNDKHDIKAFQ